jgi:hypothetical protein
MIKRRFRNRLEIKILVLGLIFIAVFNNLYGNIIKPAIFVLILLSVSLLYKIIFKTNSNGGSIQEPVMKERPGDKVDNLVSKINDVLKSIKEKAKEDTKFMVISSYISEIHEFEKVIPMLYEAYKKGKHLVYSNQNVYAEFGEIEEKLKTATGGAKNVYQMTLEEKRKTLNEVESIKSNTDEIESKLYYIFTILQKIETTIDSADINEQLTDKDMTELNTQLEVFSDSVKDIIKSVKV